MEVHERVYRELKASGCKGWGGSNFERRMDGWNEQLNLLFELIDLKGNQVLELGSGAGDVSLMIAQRGYSTTGVEIAPTAVKWACQKADSLNVDVRFICSSVTSQSILENETFDLIIDGNCLHCLFDKDRQLFFDNARRLINDGGYLFISSAILKDESDVAPKISSIERCFVTSRSIVEVAESRGFKLLKEWRSKGTHEHYYGLFAYINKEEGE